MPIYKNLINISKLTDIIDGIQKGLVLYDKISPVIISSVPLINNIKTSFKLAAAFKKYNFFEMPSQEILEDKNTEESKWYKSSQTQEERKLENPYYP